MASPYIFDLGSIGIVSGSTTLSSSYSISSGSLSGSFSGSVFGTSSWAISTSLAVNAISSSYAANSATSTTASYVLQAVSASNANLLNGLSSTVFATTSSNTFIGNQIVTGSVIVTGSTTSTLGFTGSLLGTASTASYVQTAQTASYVLTAQTASYVTTAQTASYVQTAQTASYVLQSVSASNASLLDGLDSTIFATTGSNTFKSNQTITGSVTITGSLITSGSSIATLGYTGSLLGTASTASYVQTAQTASYVLTAQTASYVITSLTASYVLTSSYANNADLLDGLNSTVFATTGSNTFNGNQTITGSTTITGSQIISGSSVSTLGYTGSLLGTASTASYVLQAVSSSFTTLAQTANTASYVITAQTASYVLTAQTASYVTTAQTASYVLQAVSASNAALLDGLDSTVFATTGSNTFKSNQIITGSVNVTGSLIVIGSISGSSITGSLLGTATTASYVQTAQTASYVLQSVSSSFTTLAQTANTASYVLQAISASYASIASNIQGGATNYIPLWNSSTSLSSSVMYQNGSNVGIGTISPNALLDITSPVDGGAIRISSNQNNNIHNAAIAFGSLEFYSADVDGPGPGVRGSVKLMPPSSASVEGAHLTFNVSNAVSLNYEAVRITNLGNVGIGTTNPISGTLQVNGNVYADSYTGSLLGTASNATQASTASYALQAVSSSFTTLAQTANTASYVVTAQTASYVQTAQTASYIITAQTASYVITAQTASYVQTAQTASYVLQSVSASYAAFAQTANTASYIVTAQTASYVITAQTASYVTTAQTASYVLQAVSASRAVSASFATTAITASYVANAFIQGGNSFGTTATLGTNDAQALILETSGSTRMTIGGVSGNVGIGTTTPGAKLVVYDNATGYSSFFYGSNGDTGIAIGNITGNTGSIQTVNSQSSAVRNLVINPLVSGNGGNVGIGQSNPQYKLDVTGSARITSALSVGTITPSATVGRIDASNDVVAFSTSDSRFKANVTSIPNALNKIDQIGGYEFDWISNPELHGYEGHDVGVIAQEIEAVLPEVVTTRDNGYKAVKYEKIVPLLIQAIKEQQKQIENLQSQIDLLNK